MREHRKRVPSTKAKEAEEAATLYPTRAQALKHAGKHRRTNVLVCTYKAQYEFSALLLIH